MRKYKQPGDIKVGVVGYGASFNMGRGHLNEMKKAGMTPVAVADIDASRLERIRAEGAELLGPRVTFELMIVDSIPSEASGKYRPARSLVTSSYDGVRIPDAAWAEPSRMGEK